VGGGGYLKNGKVKFPLRDSLIFFSGKPVVGVVIGSNMLSHVCVMMFVSVSNVVLMFSSVICCCKVV